ncbi:hypothetical protein KP509_38G035800 [Ceratopteris richardii]|uniref:Uncharacterized protein n=1 Tax=Ceratopteris richardii TaxID=49495 RepID=A0A8T2Q355_CERRI|nr:hypothetical protein KP509_38G035800 [Ceratopteris richardii]
MNNDPFLNECCSSDKECISITVFNKNPSIHQQQHKCSRHDMSTVINGALSVFISTVINMMHDVVYTISASSYFPHLIWFNQTIRMDKASRRNANLKKRIQPQRS